MHTSSASLCTVAPSPQKIRKSDSLPDLFCGEEMDDSPIFFEGPGTDDSLLDSFVGRGRMTLSSIF